MMHPSARLAVQQIATHSCSCSCSIRHARAMRKRHRLLPCATASRAPPALQPAVYVTTPLAAGDIIEGGTNQSVVIVGDVPVGAAINADGDIVVLGRYLCLQLHQQTPPTHIHPDCWAPPQAHPKPPPSPPSSWTLPTSPLPDAFRPPPQRVEHGQ